MSQLVTDGLTDRYPHKNDAFSLVFNVIRRMSRGLFWSWFDVNRSTFRYDMRKNNFYVFVLSDLDF